MKRSALGPLWLCISSCTVIACPVTHLSGISAGYAQHGDSIADSSRRPDRGIRVYPYFYVGLAPRRWAISGGIGLRYRWMSVDGGGIVPEEMPVITAGDAPGPTQSESFYRRMIGGDASIWYEWSSRLDSYLSLGLYWGHLVELGRDEATGRYYKLDERLRFVPGIGIGATYDIPSGLTVSGVRFHFTVGIRAHTVTGIAVTYGFGFRD